MFDFIYTLCLKYRNEKPENIGVNFIRDYLLLNFLIYGWFFGFFINLYMQDVKTALILSYLMIVFINVIKLFLGKFEMIKWLYEIEKQTINIWFYMIIVLGLVLNIGMFIFIKSW